MQIGNNLSFLFLRTVVAGFRLVLLRGLESASGVFIILIKSAEGELFGSLENGWHVFFFGIYYNNDLVKLINKGQF